MANPIAPTIHLNGTGAEDLFKQYADAAGALRSALEALPVPNARDYYVAGDDAFPRARREHEARLASLRAVLGEVHEILESISDQRDEGAR